MLRNPSYACIGIIDWQLEGAAVETISIHEKACALSGAWFFDKSQHKEIVQLVRNGLLIEIGTRPMGKFEFDVTTLSVLVDDFLVCAKQECMLALQEYETIKDKFPAKRKKLVEPDFTSWPDFFDLENASNHLLGVKRAASIKGTDPEMERVLSASRLIKWMIDGWLHDEQERKERKYISASKPNIRILPTPWLKFLQIEKY